MAGPWFAVHRCGDDWQRLDQVWISDGQTDQQGHLDVRMRLVRTEQDDNLSPDRGNTRRIVP